MSVLLTNMQATGAPSTFLARSFFPALTLDGHCFFPAHTGQWNSVFTGKKNRRERNILNPAGQPFDRHFIMVKRKGAAGGVSCGCYRLRRHAPGLLIMSEIFYFETVLVCSRLGAVPLKRAGSRRLGETHL